MSAHTHGDRRPRHLPCRLSREDSYIGLDGPRDEGPRVSSSLRLRKAAFHTTIYFILGIHVFPYSPHLCSFENQQIPFNTLFIWLHTLLNIRAKKLRTGLALKGFTIHGETHTEFQLRVTNLFFKLFVVTLNKTYSLYSNPSCTDTQTCEIAFSLLALSALFHLIFLNGVTIIAWEIDRVQWEDRGGALSPARIQRRPHGEEVWAGDGQSELIQERRTDLQAEQTPWTCEAKKVDLLAPDVTRQVPWCREEWWPGCWVHGGQEKGVLSVTVQGC